MGNTLIRRSFSTSRNCFDIVTKERARFTYCQDNFDKLNFNVYPYYIERAWWQRGARMTFWATWRQAANVRRRQAFATYGPDRVRYKAMATNNILPRAITDEFREKLRALPKDAHPKLVIKMCMFTGRSRGKFNSYRVNRHIFRLLADKGNLCGVKRAIWGRQ